MNRDRDSYQVPLALAEAGWLQALVTDVYASDRLARLVPSLAHRRVAGVSAELSRSSLTAVLVQMAGIKLLHRPEVNRLILYTASSATQRSWGGAHAIHVPGFCFAVCRSVRMKRFTDPQLEGRRRVLACVSSAPATDPCRYCGDDDNRAAFPEIAWTVREHAKTLPQPTRGGWKTRRITNEPN